jgi:hypothetical protein
VYSSPKIIKVNKSRAETGGTCNMHGGMITTYNESVGKPEGKRLFGIPSHR